MSKSNQVYTCNNSDCEPFLFQGQLLLEVVVDDRRYSLSPYSDDLQYYSEDGTAFSGNAKCPHCQRKCLKKPASVALNVKQEDVVKQIDKLDGRINDLLKLFQGK